MKTYEAFYKTYGHIRDDPNMVPRLSSQLPAIRDRMLHASYAIYSTDDILQDRIAIFRLLYYPRYENREVFQHEILDSIRERAQQAKANFHPILQAFEDLWDFYHGGAYGELQPYTRQWVKKHCRFVVQGIMNAQERQSIHNDSLDPLALAMRHFTP